MGTTYLVHENFLHMIRAGQIRVEDKRHFFAFAAKTMRNIIVDEARAANAERRGGAATHITLTDDQATPYADAHGDPQILDVHEALLALEHLDPELAEVVEMRYFGGYSEQEIAELQNVTERTVRRRWDKARSFLLVMLRSH